MKFEDMKKIYTTPALDVVSFNCNDIVTSSDPNSIRFGTDGYANSTQGADAKRRTDIWGED